MMGDWTFFSNHGHVLVCLARNSDARLRDVAGQVGITERAVQKIVRDLQDEGYLEVTKQGRCNRYRINNRKALRHPLQAGVTIGQLLGLMSRDKPSAAGGEHPPKSARQSPLAGDADAGSQEKAPEAEAPEDGASREGTTEKEAPAPPEPSPGIPDEDKELPASDLEQGQLF